jgi:predicted TIM-barrel fold metal-dependent hydrolase
MLIDFHYHLADSPKAVDDLLHDMDSSGVEWTLLMGLDGKAYWDYMKCGFASNESVRDAVKKHPDRLLGNLYLDPRNPGALDTFERYMDLGFKCVKLFPPAGFDPGDEKYFRLYEAIESRGVPVLAHAGQTNIRLLSDDPKARVATDSRFAHPMNFDRIARLFPGITWVLAHMGYPYFVDAWSVAHANQNVYLDISGSGPWTDGIPLVYNAVGGQNWIPIDFARVIWGSDNCMPQAEHIAQMTVFMKQIGAKKKDRALIFGDTAKKLLKL